LNRRQTQRGESAGGRVHPYFGVEQDVGLVVTDLNQPLLDRLRSLYKSIDLVFRPFGLGILEGTCVVEKDFEALPIHVRNDALQNHVPHGVPADLTADDQEAHASAGCSTSGGPRPPIVGRRRTDDIAIASQQ
jgi:hypothetical protein